VATIVVDAYIGSQDQSQPKRDYNRDG
jgi:hypothetical protein